MIIKFAHDHCKSSTDLPSSDGKNTYHQSLVLDQDQSTRQSKTHIFGIITSIDLLEFIVKHNKQNETAMTNGFHDEEKKGSKIAEQTEALQ